MVQQHIAGILTSATPNMNGFFATFPNQLVFFAWFIDPAVC